MAEAAILLTIHHRIVTLPCPVTSSPTAPKITIITNIQDLLQAGNPHHLELAVLLVVHLHPHRVRMDLMVAVHLATISLLHTMLNLGMVLRRVIDDVGVVMYMDIEDHGKECLW